MSPFVPNGKVNVVLEISMHHAPVTTFLSVPFFNGVFPFPFPFPLPFAGPGLSSSDEEETSLTCNVCVHVMLTWYVSLITHTDPSSLRSTQSVLHAVTMGVYDLE